MDNSFHFKFLEDKYAALRDHKILFSFILIAVILFSVYLISAESFQVTTVPISINEDNATFTTVNFTINNTQVAQNITNVTIRLPPGFNSNNFNITSNGSTPEAAGITGVAYFNSSGRNITWVNATHGLINSSTNRSFWIDINQSAPGTYNITINITYANLSTDYYNQSFTVNDTTIPTVTTNLQNNSNLTGAADEFNVTVIDVSKNLTGVFAAIKNSTGYYTLAGAVITTGSDYTNWTNLPSFNATRYSNNISSNNLADGPYYLYVNATDNATNNGTAPVINITIDNTAPTAINLVQPLNATISTNRTPTLQWEPTADITFINYTVQIDDNSDFSSITNTTGTYLNTTNKTGVTGTTLNADATYYLRVTAWDDVGQSAVTAKFVYTTDNTAPILTINLVNNSNLTAAADYFNVTVTDANKNYTGVFAALKNSTGYYNLSGSVITTGSDYMNWTNLPSFNATRYSNNISSNNLADGPYYLYVNATDNATNNGTAPVINITIDNTAPTAFNISAPANFTISTNRTPTVKWEATSDITFINYSLQFSSNSDFSNINLTKATTINSSNISGVVTGDGLVADATYYVRVTARDDLGQTYTTPSFTYIIDNTASSLTINLANNSNLTAAADYFNVTVTDTNKNTTGVFAALKNATGYYNLSGVVITTGSDYMNWTSIPAFNATRYSANITSNLLADGPYYLYVNATDNATNNGTAPRINITIDNTAPVITINLVNVSNFTGAADNFNVTIIDISKNVTGVFAALKNSTGYYNLSGAVITSGSEYTNWTNLPSFNATRYSNNISSNNFADGSYLLYVNASDYLANNGTAPVINITVDNAAPVVRLMSPENATQTTTAAQVFQCNATEQTEISNMTLYIYDAVNSSLVKINVSSSVSAAYNETSFAYTLPYLGDFLWNCRANDTLENSGWASQNRTIALGAEAAASTGGSGGGGGTAPGTTYDAGALTTSITQELKMGDTAKFTVEGASHTVRIMGLTASTASVQIRSVLITKLLALGAPAEEVDIDNDGVNELSLKLESISLSSSKVNITITPLVGAITTPPAPETNVTEPEAPPAEEQQPAAAAPPTTATTPTAKKNQGLIISIILVSVVAIIIGAILLKKSKKPIWQLWS